MCDLSSVSMLKTDLWEQVEVRAAAVYREREREKGHLCFIQTMYVCTAS